MGFDRWRYVLPLRLRSIFRSSAVERELDDELRDHVACEIETNLARGMTPIEARRAALLAIGGLEQQKEACRDRRRVGLAEHAIRDTRYGLRLLRRSPVFTAVAILSLALGIGANGAIFHLIDTIRLRRLGVAHAEELGEVRFEGPQAYGTYEGVNAKATRPLWDEVRAHQQAFAAMFAWGDAQFVVGRGAQARGVRGLWVSGDFFRVLGIAPARGRLLGPADDRAGCGAGAAVISHAFWQSYFGGRDSAIGAALTVLDQPFIVAGVVPPSFTGVEVGQTFDVALPVCAAPLWDPTSDRPDRWWLTLMGRLEPGWTIAGADEHLRALGPGFLEATIPPGYDAGLVDGYRRLRVGVVPAGRGVSRLRDTHSTSLSLLLGLTGLVLLMTCGNLATLMLARASAREREVAVRTAIGASRARLVSQMSIESLLVAAAGAVLAVPVALASARALVALLGTTGSPVTLPLAADWRLLAFVGAAATVTAILFGLLPALRVSLVDPIAVMRQASRGLTIDRHRARFQRGLVVVQIAVSLVLIVAALLFVRTFRNLAAVDTGFDAANTIVVSFRDRASAALSPEQKAAFQTALTDAIASVPGVARAASSTHVPLSGGVWSHFFRVAGSSSARQRASRFAYVSPGYFATLRVPLRAGRDFTAGEDLGSRRVMVVNESFVRSHLGGISPIGATIRTLEEPGFPEVTYEIVGIAGDTKYATLRDENCWCERSGELMAPIAYVPIAQNPSPYAWASVIVRSSGPIAGLTGTIAQRVERLNPAIAIGFDGLESGVHDRLRGERMMAWLAGAFAALAMALVIVGLYGIVAYLAAGRRNEIGIRLALGATRGQIVALVLRDNVRVIAAGVAIGLPLAIGVMRSARALLFGLSPADAPTVVTATAVLATAGMLAAAVPAWRAARTRPEEALRAD